MSAPARRVRKRRSKARGIGGSPEHAGPELATCYPQVDGGRRALWVAEAECFVVVFYLEIP